MALSDTWVGANTHCAGTCDAKHHSSGGFWTDTVKFPNGIRVVDAFSDRVRLHRRGGREQVDAQEVRSQVLAFKPAPARDR